MISGCLRTVGPERSYHKQSQKSPARLKRLRSRYRRRSNLSSPDQQVLGHRVFEGHPENAQEIGNIRDAPVENELREAPDALRSKLLELYSPIRRLKPTRMVSELSLRYVRTGVFPPDALIASFASAHKLDDLVTINRRHLKRPDTVRRIANVNRRFRLLGLRILLPGELIELVS